MDFIRRDYMKTAAVATAWFLINQPVMAQASGKQLRKTGHYCRSRFQL